ncbi:hypothetical protein RSOLAG1IB_12111 [Rhizoctonia solani AG-1 IB]|uniref:Uncharacterized protein n=1 Tax=Thanatephorus cucumeris (strain AG1-IB / isolate 7/3/14) TaxID=1108050 RepID=A0A0B7FI12_THACB|nr:hypothetical protein RSOLAG1IB_12111 [Rhizoctonia solani AG-1 IB]
MEAERTLGHVGESKKQRPNHERIEDDILKIYKGTRGCRMIGHVYTLRPPTVDAETGLQHRSNQWDSKTHPHRHCAPGGCDCLSKLRDGVYGRWLRGRGERPRLDAIEDGRRLATCSRPTHFPPHSAGRFLPFIWCSVYASESRSRTCNAPY